MGSDLFHANPFFWASIAGLCAGAGLGRLFVPNRSRRNPAAFRSRGRTVCLLFLSAASGSCLACFFLCPHGRLVDARLVFAASGAFGLGFAGRLFPRAAGIPFAALFLSFWVVAIAAASAWKPLVPGYAILMLSVEKYPDGGYAVSLTCGGVPGRQSFRVAEPRFTVSVSRLAVPYWAGAFGIGGGWSLVGLSGPDGENLAVLPSAPVDLVFRRTGSAENAFMKVERFDAETPGLRDHDRLAAVVAENGVSWKRE